MISRYEIKFPLPHAAKRRFLSEARRALEPDPHGIDAAYRVTSIYFDSAGLDFYWQKVDGEGLRRKLRLRFYGEIGAEGSSDERTFFMEIKHRIKDSVAKERVRLAREGVEEILGDARALGDIGCWVEDESAEARATVRAIERLAGLGDLQATNIISYQREAWLGTIDARLRLTFDQRVTVSEPEALEALGAASRRPLIPPDYWIMELKFNEVVPCWIRDIVREQGLVPRRFSKYGRGVEVLRNLGAGARSQGWALIL